MLFDSLMTRLAWTLAGNLGSTIVLLVKIALYGVLFGAVLLILTTLPWLFGIVILFGLLAGLGYLYLTR